MTSLASQIFRFWISHLEKHWIIKFQYKPTYGPGISSPGVISVCSENPIVDAQHFSQQCVDETSGIENQTLLQKVRRVERLQFNIRCQEIKLQDVAGQTQRLQAMCVPGPENIEMKSLLQY